jgi:hypothetical protein
MGDRKQTLSSLEKQLERVFPGGGQTEAEKRLVNHLRTLTAKPNFDASQVVTLREAVHEIGNLLTSRKNPN